MQAKLHYYRYYGMQACEQARTPGLSGQSPGRDRDRAGPTNHRARLVNAGANHSSERAGSGGANDYWFNLFITDAKSEF